MTLSIFFGKKFRREFHDSAYNGEYRDWNVLLQKILRDPGARKQHRKVRRDYTSTQTADWENQITIVGARGITDDNHLTQTTNLLSIYGRKGLHHNDRHSRSVPGLRAQNRTTGLFIDVGKKGPTNPRPIHQPPRPPNYDTPEHHRRSLPHPHTQSAKNIQPMRKSTLISKLPDEADSVINQLFQDPSATTDNR